MGTVTSCYYAVSAPCATRLDTTRCMANSYLTGTRHRRSKKGTRGVGGVGGVGRSRRHEEKEEAAAKAGDEG